MLSARVCPSARGVRKKRRILHAVAFMALNTEMWGVRGATVFKRGAIVGDDIFAHTGVKQHVFLCKDEVMHFCVQHVFSAKMKSCIFA